MRKLTIWKRGEPLWRTMGSMDYRERIVIDPEIRFGKPTIKGTRVTVADVLEYMAGSDKEDVLANFPQLAADDVRACLAFAADRERHVRIAG